MRNAQPKRGKAAPLADPFISNVTCWTYTGRRLYDNNMKFIEPRPVADPEVAVRKLLKLANAFEPIQDGRIYIEKINGPVSVQGHTRRVQSRPRISDPPRAGRSPMRAAPMSASPMPAPRYSPEGCDILTGEQTTACGVRLSTPDPPKHKQPGDQPPAGHSNHNIAVRGTRPAMASGCGGPADVRLPPQPPGVRSQPHAGTLPVRSAPAEASVKEPAVPFASFDHGQTVIQHDHVALDDTCAE